MKLQKLGSVKNHTMTVVYGNNGVGKSTVIGSLPGKVLIIDTDNGLESIEGLSPDSAVAVCENFDDVLEALNLYEDYDSIAIDTFDKVQEYAISLAMTKDGKTYGKDMAQLNHYGSATQVLVQLITDITSISREGKNVLITVHEKQLENEDSRDTHATVQPNLMPKVCANLLASARIIGYLHKEYLDTFNKGKKETHEVYVGTFGGNPKLTTKVTRKPSIKAPNKVRNVTWDKMQALVTGIKPSKKDTTETTEGEE